MSVRTPTVPTSFQQEQIAAYFDGQADVANIQGDRMREWTLREHAANARNTAEYLRAPCFTCATGGQ